MMASSDGELGRWFTHGEYVDIDIDLDAGTATVAVDE